MNKVGLKISAIEFFQRLSEIFQIEEMKFAFCEDDMVFMEEENGLIRIFFPHAPSMELFMTEEDCYIFVQAFLLLIYREKYAERYAVAFCRLFFADESMGAEKDMKIFAINEVAVMALVAHLCEES